MEFQFHVTVREYGKNGSEKMIKLCEQFGVKPVFIQLPTGEYTDQPMFTYCVDAPTWEEAKAKLEDMCEQFEREMIWPTRKKAEISPYENEDYLEDGNYYEWHCRVKETNLAQLEQICQQTNCYLSRNQRREGERFLTVREEDRTCFYQQTDLVRRKLLEEKVEILKEKFEYCIFDSALHLDTGWAYHGETTKMQKIRRDIYERILRIIAQENLPLQVKGSFLHAKYFPNPEKRYQLAEDLDFVYIGPQDVDSFQIMDRYSKLFVEKLKEQPIPSFVILFPDPDWYRVNYETEDDFLTLGTDLGSLDYFGLDLSLEITFGLPQSIAPVQVQYQPLKGDAFSIPYATLPEVQVAWKLHQCLVRVRYKDLVDLAYLIQGIDWEPPQVLENMVHTVVQECALHSNKQKLIKQLKQLLSGQLSALSQNWERNASQEQTVWQSFVPENETILNYFKMVIQQYLPVQRCFQLIEQEIKEK